ncbi:MAG: hypothetical protein DI587_11900 [Variovorax paradoxus]|nr:MAG: hypothetical protein DI583_11900 [Variovorax paradoxus]PZQ11134.1 MAG: hypothetical protein DI587_11900 [Variovorax paradoxus]
MNAFPSGPALPPVPHHDFQRNPVSGLLELVVTPQLQRWASECIALLGNRAPIALLLLSEGRPVYRDPWEWLLRYGLASA